MSLFSNLVSGAVGATIVSYAKDYIEKQGGLQAVISKFEQQGLGEQVKSWVGTGKNLPISAEQISEVLDNPQVASLAAKLGISPETIKQQLAEYLPKAVDELTPTGKIEETTVAA